MRPEPPRAAAEPGPAANPDPPGLSFAVEPADALILIDGAVRGTVSELPEGSFVPLQPGLYQVVLKRAGYATWRAEVSVRRGTELIRVSLGKAP